jgi:hypothetical protein
VRKPDPFTQWVNDHNERTSKRVDRAVNWAFAFILGILGALALVHWLTPCAEGVLC